MLAEDSGNSSASRLEAIESVFKAVAGLTCLDDPFDEKSELLGRLGYLAWSYCVRWKSSAEAAEWQEITMKHVLAQQTVRDFFSVPPLDRSQSLRDSFFTDPAVLLAACARMERSRNSHPLPVLQEATLAYEWISAREPRGGAEQDYDYLRAELALSAAVGSKHCGRFRDCESWLERAVNSCRKLTNPEPLSARIELARLALWYSLRRYADVVRRIPGLAAEFVALGMPGFAARSSYLQATTLKELGRDEEALERLHSLGRSQQGSDDPYLKGLVLVEIAELEGRRACYGSAMECVLQARPLLEQAKVPSAIAYLNGIMGELFRDQGQLLAAADSYRAAVEVYSAAHMVSMAAYVRVVLAETLLAAGREDEARLEILAALPAIETENLVHEGLAAVSILRESIRRRGTDPRALRELREHLDRMR